jgi:hypothetical protein
MFQVRRRNVFFFFFFFEEDPAGELAGEACVEVRARAGVKVEVLLLLVLLVLLLVVEGMEVLLLDDDGNCSASDKHASSKPYISTKTLTIERSACGYCCARVSTSLTTVLPPPPPPPPPPPLPPLLLVVLSFMGELAWSLSLARLITSF